MMLLPLMRQFRRGACMQAQFVDDFDVSFSHGF
jgi:hypothetical protein